MKRSFVGKTKFLVGFLCLALFGLSSTAFAEEPTFRDLTRKYFKDGEGKEIAKLVGFTQPVKNLIAVDYKVMLFKDGKETPVDPKTYEFKVGDKVRVSIEPLNKYYVYIFHIGASGKSGFLLPTEDEDPPLAEANKAVALPDDGFLEITDPPGEETLLVVATEKPVGSRSVLANVLTKKPGEVDSPEELAMRKTLKATVKKALKSVRERQQEVLDKTVTWRGLTSDAKARENMAADVKKRGVTEGTFEEPTIDKTGGTAAVYAAENKDENAKLLVSIPLKSIQEKTEKK
ncbi:MAG: DUF4384 domain-containing protein [Pirellulales bacterium]|nr:DUF4384 domain-containing protein [Pirellulales bacterium]